MLYKRGSLNSASYLQVNTILKKSFCELRHQVLAFLWPAAGYRNNSNGTLNNRGNNGNYWSSTENGSTNANNGNFNSSNANTNNNNNRTNGFSVRCVSAFNTNLYYYYYSFFADKRGKIALLLEPRIKTWG
ncbi:hypothetical protein BTO16_04775 [Polaribacter glomeratus]|uniref:Uncharacterized protein n=1 Tax=Polaribacter glomeratus TaxID=102 RepID=A0A2S7WWS0_9FLAO|nr:hypothetical protein BTO16_04775 [Polaribacter glomeratus]